MKNFIRSYLFSLLIMTTAKADLAVDAATPAIRASMMNAQEVLSSPPLPSLSIDKNFHVTVSGGTSKINAHGRITGQGQDFGSYTHYSKGPAYGLGLSSPTFGSFSFFLFGTTNSTKGGTTVTLTDGTIEEVTDMKTVIKAYGFGAQYLLFGTPHSLVQMSAFAGMLFFNLQHQFTNGIVNQPGVLVTTHVSVENKGPMVGAQLRMNLGKFFLSPYFFYYLDNSDHCAAFPGAPCTAKLDNSFSAIGLNLGWGKLSVGAYTTTETKLNHSDLDMKRYQLAYTFDF